MSSIQNSLVTNFLDMEEHHIPDVLVIERDSYGYPWSEKIFYDCINNNYFCKVLVLDNKLIGYLITSIVQNECHIMNLCVKKEYRNFAKRMENHINVSDQIQRRERGENRKEQEGKRKTGGVKTRETT